MDWYFAVLEKYAVFDGRARRKEYWMFTLFHVLIILALSVVSGVTEGITTTVVTVVIVLYALATIIPTIAVSVRRLHDTGRSGWWYLISLVPVIGGIVFLIFMILDSDPGDNEYGPNPKAGEFPSVRPRSATA